MGTATRTRQKVEVLVTRLREGKHVIFGPKGGEHEFGEIRGVRGTMPRSGIRNVDIYCACHGKVIDRVPRNAKVEAALVSR